MPRRRPCGASPVDSSPLTTVPAVAAEPHRTPSN
jgi:hypothetical protein